ncbi:MAG: insulinase family protein [Clostridia bacterium]|nr:insulinase family protein [Clostridia bacterium]
MHTITKLSNGIRVVYEKIDYLKSVSVGVWVGNGSRCEKKDENGMSHFIEHMFFKGTNKRDAKQIAFDIDSIGGQINAFTTREYTCYYTKTLDEHIDIALDVLSDMIFNSKLDEKSLDLERNVIIEEINMYDDEPEEIVADLIIEAAYGNNSMGRPILGTKESLFGISSKKMSDYIKTHYTTKNIVISISGNFGDNLCDLLEKYFVKSQTADNAVKIFECDYKSGNNLIRAKDCEQVQLIAGFKSIDVKDDAVYSLLVFNNVFGGGMSARLFQNIREKYGLVYSVFAYHAAYMGTGMFNISAAMAPQNVKKVCELISNEINIIKRDKLSDEELRIAKEQLKGNYILSYESTGSRMQAAGRNLLLEKDIISPDEVLDKINKVNSNSVAEIIDRVLDVNTLNIAAVGQIDSVNELFNLQ